MSGSTVDTSRRVVEAAARGDRQAQRELFETFREVAFRVALRVTGRN